MIGIYKIENLETKKKYIGQSKNIEKRIKKHKNELNNGTHHSWKLQQDWNKYGEKNFKFDIVEAYESLDDKEQYYIDKYDTIENGYNCVEVGYIPNNANKSKEGKEFNIDDAYFNINNETPFNERLTDMDVAVYACMKVFYSHGYDAVSSITSIYDMLSFSKRNLQKDIKESLIHLSELDYIGVYDMLYNEIDINVLKPNDSFIVYFGKDGIWHEDKKEYCEYFPVTRKDFSIILEKSKSVKARCKFIRFALCVARVAHVVDGWILEPHFITLSKVNHIVSNANTMTTYLDLLSDIFYYTNSFVNAKGKNCSTYIARKSKYKSFNDFNDFVYNNIKNKGYYPINKEDECNRKKEGIKKSKNKE